MSVILEFDGGTLVISGEFPSRLFPDSVATWDTRIGRFRSPAVCRRALLKICERRGISVEDRSSTAHDVPLEMRTTFSPHPYQQAAIAAWQRSGQCGTVILPTGAGKTYVALRAIAQVGRSALIVVPTLDLMHQWYAILTETFGIEVGVLGGGEHDVRELTVTTYDSAYLCMPRLGGRFDLLIFDEVHHLPAPNYRQIPAMSTALSRLGLTATYERPDGAHTELDYLVGPVVYHASLDALAGQQLAEYEIVRLRVPLTDEEAESYQSAATVYRAYLRTAGITPHGAGWKEFVKRSGRDPAARAALLARGEMKRLVVSAARKLELLEMLLRWHPTDKILIFTEYTDLVYRIAEEFLIPPITHYTGSRERKWILEQFRAGLLNRVVSAHVFNEGVDVPSANVGIILGGSSSPREYVQRLGRLLRKGSNGKIATLYEVITSATNEEGVSARRRHTHAFT